MLTSFIIYSGIVFAMATIGGMIPLFVSGASDNKLKLFVSFGAGALLGMSFLHMLPEASHLLEHNFGAWFLVGFLILLILERFVMVHACEEHGCHYHTVGVAAFAGLAIHGVIEGFALASTIFVAELSQLGILVFLGIVAHKIPAGVALTTLLKLSGKSTKQILLFVMGVAITVPLGALIAYTLLTHETMNNTAGILLAISSGTFVYIGACDLLPELHKNDDQKLRRLGAFLFGLLLCYVSGRFLSHSH